MTDATVIPIADVQLRERVKVRGRVRSLRVRPWADSPTLEVVLVDDTAGITVVFLARRRIGGVRPGTVMSVEGMVGAHERRLAILNPEYELENQSTIAG
jgi:RecG-like helicase